MRTRIYHLLTTLVAALLFIPAALKAQDQMVVVTYEGDVQIYPTTAVSNFSYDAENDAYTMQVNGESLIFDANEVKHIYFADKAETDAAPFIEPQATDKFNPNFERPEVGSYEILSMDTELGRVKVRFHDQVPQLYVGKILSLENNERSYNCFVLAHKIDDKTADISFRFAQIGEVLYNNEFVLATGSDSYFEAAGAPIYHANTLQTRAVDLATVDIKGAKVTMYADMGITLDTQDNSSLSIDAKLKLSEPRKNEKSRRSFLAKIEYMGVVARGKYEKTTTLTMTPKLGLKLEKDDYRKTPIFKAPPVKFLIPVGPAVIPVTLDLSATLGYNIQADINAELELQQQTTTGLTMTAGIEYDGNETKPIFNVTPIFKPEKPKIISKQGTVTARFSPYLRLDLLIDVVFGSHVDLMPYLQATYTGVERKGVDDFGSFELEAGGNLRGGLYLNVPFLDNDDYASAMTEDPIKKVIYKSPGDIKPLDEAKVTWCSMDVTDTRDFQTTATFVDEQVTPDWGQEHAVMQCQVTDYNDEGVRKVFSGGGNPSFLPRRASDQMPAPIELHQIGEEWATQCDENGIAHTTFKCNVPLGYRTILKTRIMDGKGNTIKELEEEMPWEIKNFNATVDFGSVHPATIRYRDGGKYVYEEVSGDDGTVACYEYNNGNVQMWAKAYPQYKQAGTVYSMPVSAMMFVLIPNFPTVVQDMDFERWLVEEIGINRANAVFGEEDILGHKCKTFTTSKGSWSYWQNLMMKTEADGQTVRVTKLEILDNPLE